MTGWKQSAVGLGLVLIVAASANVACVAARDEGRSRMAAEGHARSRASDSRPYFVTASCRQSRAVQDACAVAIRYLRALDLDRFEAACSLLAPGTLRQAGGIERCVTTVSSARGTRIRYGIHGAVETVLGTSIYFRTRGIRRTGPGIDQTMIVRPTFGGPRIWIVTANSYDYRDRRPGQAEDQEPDRRRRSDHHDPAERPHRLAQPSRARSRRRQVGDVHAIRRRRPELHRAGVQRGFGVR